MDIGIRTGLRTGQMLLCYRDVGTNYGVERVERLAVQCLTALLANALTPFRPLPSGSMNISRLFHRLQGINTTSGVAKSIVLPVAVPSRSDLRSHSPVGCQ